MRGIAKFNNHREKPLVFLSPLNWGLGHTIRCIPIIAELLRLGCDVIVACTETQKVLLAEEFQTVRFVIIEDEPPAYGNSRLATLLKLLFQAPKLLRKVKRENRWLQQFLAHTPVDAIISDNRFGLYTSGIPCIFITHQLHIKTGLGPFFDRLAQQLNYRYIGNFSACWIPDNPGHQSLAGKLSNPGIPPPVPVHYIGPLSRFAPCATAEQGGNILIVLSGPEPQRTLLEKQVLSDLSRIAGQSPAASLSENMQEQNSPTRFAQQSPVSFSDNTQVLNDLSHVADQSPETFHSDNAQTFNDLSRFTGRVHLVRGLPGNAPALETIPGINVYNHVSAETMNKLVCSATWIISRAGYTTVMDMLKLDKKTILIPTPGQAEQEYIAAHLHKQQLAFTIPQHRFSLPLTLQEAAQFPYRKEECDMEGYKKDLQQFVDSLIEKRRAAADEST